MIKTTKDLINKVSSFSKTERIQRLITLNFIDSPLAVIEIAMIQAIREGNGEIAEVIASRVGEDD